MIRGILPNLKEESFSAVSFPDCSMIRFQTKLFLLVFAAGFLFCGGCALFKKDLPEKDIPSFFDSQRKEKSSISEFISSYGLKKSPKETEEAKKAKDGKEEESWFSGVASLFGAKKSETASSDDEAFMEEEGEKVSKDSRKKEPDKGSTFLLSAEAKEIYANTER